jgi:hypothetical protein
VKSKKNNKLKYFIKNFLKKCLCKLIHRHKNKFVF